MEPRNLATSIKQIWTASIPCAIAIAIALCTLTSPSKASNPQPTRVDVGGAILDAPSPIGFHEVAGHSPELINIAETLTPPSNRLLGMFATESDLRRINNGGNIQLDRYMMLQVLRELESKTISIGQFRQMVVMIEKQYGTFLDNAGNAANGMLDNASHKLSEEYGIATKMEVGKQDSLGVIFKQPNAIGFASLSKYAIETDGVKGDYVVAMGTTFLLVKGKVIYAYVYATLKGPEDIDWVKSKTRKWSEAILIANGIEIDPPVLPRGLIPLETTTTTTGAESDPNQTDGALGWQPPSLCVFLSTLLIGGPIGAGVLALTIRLICYFFMAFQPSFREAYRVSMVIVVSSMLVQYVLATAMHYVRAEMLNVQVAQLLVGSAITIAAFSLELRMSDGAAIGLKQGLSLWFWIVLLYLLVSMLIFVGFKLAVGQHGVW